MILMALAGAFFGLLLGGCGDGSDGDSDPQEVLEATFNGEGEEVESGVLEIAVEASASGKGGGSLNGSLEGPFEARGEEEPPLVDMSASLQVEGGKQSTDFEGGLTITEEAAFVTVDGQPYEVDPSTYELFSEQFAQSAATQDEQGGEGAAVFERLGIDPSSWLTDVSNEGTQEIEGTETIHITGTADVAQIVEDAQALDPTGNALGAAGSGQLAEAVQSATIDVYTGADDNILRRLELSIEIADPGASGEKLTLGLTIGVSGVNEEQSFEAPANAKPLEDLVGGIGGALQGDLGDLGGVLEGGSGSGAGQGGSGGGGGGLGLGAFPPEYQDCVAQAQSPEDVAACNELLQQ